MTLAAALATAVLLVAILAADATSAAATAGAERRAAISVARAETALVRAVQIGIDAIDVIAARAATAGPASVTGLGIGARGIASVSWAPRGSTQGSALAAALDTARDQGVARISAPYRRGGRRVVAAVRAVYEDSGSLTVDAGPGTSGQRRDRLSGWVIGIIPTDRVINAAAQNQLSLTATDGSSVVGRSNQRSGGLISEMTVEIGGRQWSVRAFADTDVPLTPRYWMTLLAGIAVAIAVALSTSLDVINRKRLEAQLGGLQGELGMIEDVAPIVQNTLDLALVLPATAIRLTDRLSLTGIAFTVIDDDGRANEIFSYGALPHSASPTITSLRQSVGANTELALSLQRGGRVGGVLRVRTGRALSAAETAALGAVAEMMSSALMNARAFEQQAQAVKRLGDLDVLKTAFLETASHELRTPVTAIAGFARLVHEQWDELPEEHRRLFVERIWANAGVLDNLVSDLLNFSSAERGSLQVSAEPVDLSALAPEVITRLLPVFDRHRIVADATPGIVVVGDRTAIEQVLTNLLSNAAKFSPDNSEIVVNVRMQDGRGLLTVDDAGPGVPLAERERIFSRFFRGRGVEVIRTRGAGIGLSVVKALADTMKATVEVGESPSGGARFTVSFPAPLDSTVALDLDKEVAHATQP